jgi:hypothetical protein
MRAQSVEQEPGKQSFINRIIKKDSNKHAKGPKLEYIDKRGCLWSEKFESDGFEGQVIERIRMLINDLRSNSRKVINHIWGS